MTLPNEDLQIAHQHAGETKSRVIWEYLCRRLNTRPKERLNGEGWLVRERRDTPSYALKSSQVNQSITELALYRVKGAEIEQNDDLGCGIVSRSKPWDQKE